MLNQNQWRSLQLFGGEGASGAPGGDGGGQTAAPGEESADAGHRRLRELGVPESKLRKHTTAPASALPEVAVRTQPEGRMTWEEIVKDPEYNSELQKIVKARVKDEGRSKAILDTLEPALKQLAARHGLDPENLDHAALAEAITGSHPRSEQEQQGSMQQQRFLSHIRSLEQQGQALKAVFPGFDLREELRDPLFARLTAPGVGLSVEDAYHAVHRRQIQQQSMQAAARKTQELIANAIRSGTHRPDESGTAAQAPSVSRFDYRSATPAQRKAIKDEIRRAAAEGRKVYPG